MEANQATLIDGWDRKEEPLIAFAAASFRSIYKGLDVITGSHAGAIRGLIASLATEFAIKVCFFLCTIFLVYKHGEMMRVLSYVRVNTSMT